MSFAQNITTSTPSALSGINPDSLLKRNEDWARRMHPGLFARTATQQTPSILWIGCIDSRVPETTIFDLLPGDIFSHRNIANLLPPDDLSSLSVLEFAVGTSTLGVQHVIICGHTNCGGVNAALKDRNPNSPSVAYWVDNIRKVVDEHQDELDSIPDLEDRKRRLVELNVAAQVRNCHQNAHVGVAITQRGLKVHGFVYDVARGRCRVLQGSGNTTAIVFTDM